MSAAPGGPGLPPTWTSSAKDLVTTALDGVSRVWLTLGHGIGNEIYWPSTGQPQVRDIGFVVTKQGTWTEVKRANHYDLTTPAPAVLVPTTTHHGDGWTLTLDWIVDPDRDVVLVEYQLDGDVDGLFVLVAPHLGHGKDTNSAWTDRDLFARSDGTDVALCVAATPPVEHTSVGYVGTSDGWQDITAHSAMTWAFDSAPHGNVALTAQLSRPGGVVAIGFASTSEGAATLAHSSLATGFGAIAGRFAAGWERFAGTIDTDGIDPRWSEMTQRSAAVLACHEDRNFPGATVASLSIPWGNDRSDLGGYHLVWARDCVESALAEIALGRRSAATRTLAWLCATQQPDGHWGQNSYPDGRPFWTGVQLDETALPILLAATLEIDRDDPSVAPMVRSAVQFLVAHGPASPQDRWEENAGTNAFTLATVIVGLIAARHWSTPEQAAYLTSLADYWNERIEDWLYVAHGELCEGRAIDGYYIRLGSTNDQPSHRGRIDVHNRDDVKVEPDQLIALDFLALVRFGLRHPHDQHIVDSVELVDELLAVELPTGIAYRRYNGDGYGEHDDGSPFDGTGIGRPWPLLAGERGHYAAQAGDDYNRYLDSMAAMTGPGRTPARTSLGRPRHPHPLPHHRPPDRFGDAARMGPRRVRQTRHLRPTWPPHRAVRRCRRSLRGHCAIASTWHWRTDAPFTRRPERASSTDRPPDTVHHRGCRHRTVPANHSPSAPRHRHRTELDKPVRLRAAGR